MKLIKEELDNLNLDIETKARETVNPVYADAIRQLKVNDEKREADRKLPATPKTEEPKPIKNELLKKMHLSESLFDNEQDLKPLTDEERDYLNYLRRKEKVTSLDKEELWELMDLEEREDLIDDEDWDEEDDIEEALEEDQNDILPKKIGNAILTINNYADYEKEGFSRQDVDDWFGTNGNIRVTYSYETPGDESSSVIGVETTDNKYAVYGARQDEEDITFEHMAEVLVNAAESFDFKESLEEKKDASTNLFTRLSDKLDANGYTLFAPIRNEAKLIQRTKDDENFKYDYRKAKQILDELKVKYDIFEGESYKKPFIKVYFKDEDLYEGLKENKESVYNKLMSYLNTL